MSKKKNKLQDSDNKFEFTEKLEKLLLLLLILVGTYIRILKIDSPLLDVHSWRQTQTAMFARNFYRNNFKIFYPQIDWDGKNPGYYETEFQLYPAIVSFLYLFFGVKESLGRLVSVLFSLGSMYFLFLLVKKYSNAKTAFFSLFFFIISPLNIFFSRAFMPEATMIFFSITSLYYFSEYLDKEETLDFVLAIFCTTLAFLVKIPTLYLGFPLLFLAYLKYDKKMFFQNKLYLFAFLVLIFPFIWYIHSYNLGKLSGLSEGIWTVGKDKWGNFSLWINPNFYISLFNRIYYFTLTPPGFYLFLFGLLLKVENKREYLFHIYLSSIVIYFFVVAFGNMVHSYYQLPFLPSACFFIGKSLNFLFEKNFFDLEKKVVNFFLVVLLFCSCYLSYFFILPSYNCNMSYYFAALETNQITKKDDLVITAISSLPEVLYYSDRKGYHIDPWESQPNSIDNFIKNGAKYLVVVLEKELTSKWKNYLKKFKVISENTKFKFIIYDLTNAK